LTARATPITRRTIEASLRGRSTSKLGLRELAAEAGLAFELRQLASKSRIDLFG
jgi:hypothetical protein